MPDGVADQFRDHRPHVIGIDGPLRPHRLRSVVGVRLTCSYRADHGGLSVIEWRKSSRSNASGEECVEVAALAEGRGVRDSKAPDAGYLALTTEGFARLLARVKQDEVDLDPHG
ncbi:DUF397 domain-containing protein [Actinomadura madurae]